VKDEALALVERLESPGQKLNLLREYVQACVLRSLHESEAFSALAFVGGTALRFLENLPRFSEDMDFSVVAEEYYEPLRLVDKVKRDLLLAGFDCTIRWNDRKTVHEARIRIERLLKEAGLAVRENQSLSIKLEIDSRPPAGADVARTLINRHFTFVARHYTLTSLMAGKVHALMTRPYPKGRDWYDLIWYRARRPPTEPNLELLQNALDQTQGEGRFAARDWIRHVREKLADISTEKLIDDVSAFLERPADRSLLARENLEAVLATR
jgi:predicted nucleotidyltransferase component of viral defense system